MKSDSLRKREVEETVGGGGQGGIAVVDVPLGRRVEGALDVVHEVEHFGGAFILSGSSLGWRMEVATGSHLCLVDSAIVASRISPFPTL